jgi:hypothetical protein
MELVEEHDVLFKPRPMLKFKWCLDLRIVIDLRDFGRDIWRRFILWGRLKVHHVGLVAFFFLNFLFIYSFWVLDTFLLWMVEN